MRTTLTATALATAALAAAVLGSWSPAAAQDPAARTLAFTELEKGSTFTHVRNTKTKSQRSNNQGDLIVFTNPIADGSGKVVGKLQIQCVTTTGSPNFLKSTAACTGSMVIPGGTLTLQALVRPGVAATNGAITGGTGAYANARGTFVSVERKGGSDDTITLAG